MTADFSIQRIKMVDRQLRATNVSDILVPPAMGTVPREEFVPSLRCARSHID